jgi:hypothetical protein
MEVPRGPIDLRAMFGQDVMLVHSTGALLPVNDYGILTQSLQMGESYFLVISHIASLTPTPSTLNCKPLSKYIAFAMHQDINYV